MSARFERQARLTDNFSQVPHGLWTADLTWGAKCLLGWLHSHDERYLASLSNNRIRNELGCSGSVGGWIDELVDAGLIRVEKHGQRNKFVLLAAPWEALACRKGSDQPTEKRQLDASDNQPAEKRSVSDRLPAGNQPKNGYIEDHVVDHRADHSLAQSLDIVQEGEILTGEIVTDVDSSFAHFWSLYPRKVAKPKALAIWKKMTPAERDMATDAIPAHVHIWRADGRAMKHIPHPTTWLNERRYEDPLETDYQPQGSLVQRAARFALEAQARREHDRGTSVGSDRHLGRHDDGMDRRVGGELLPGSDDVGRRRDSGDGDNPFSADVD